MTKQPTPGPVQPVRLTNELLLGRLTLLALDSRLRQALTDGYQEHGEAFLAYLVGTPALSLPVDTVTSMFTRSYIGRRRHRHELFAELIHYYGERGQIPSSRRPSEGTTVEEFLRWYTNELRAQVDGRYAFIEGTKWWYVFDTQLITNDI